MKQSQQWGDRWKAGIGIMARIVWLSFLVNMVCLPFIAIKNADFLQQNHQIVMGVIYTFLVLPFLMPGLLRISGFVTRKVDEIDGSGDMNQSSHRKQRELQASATSSLE